MLIKKGNKTKVVVSKKGETVLCNGIRYWSR
ncbi:hypothetical protein ACQX0N_02675 [Clostridium tepidum]|nr:hypothetical protein [Clostridium tepidum]MCR1934060.1 hypothetical protein [Clostridium tepidum]MDU6877862.1 hypothetical protein [Clostridium botulinum]